MAQVQNATPEVGDQAPPFTLKDSDMKSVSLQDFRGKTVIVAFFPAAFSRVCTSELCIMADHTRDLTDADAQVLAISVDLPYTLKHFKQEKGLTFPVLSDFDRAAIEAYGVVDRNFGGYTSGVAQRSVFIVDPDGRISWKWVSDAQSDHPEYDEVLQAAGAVQLT